MSDQTRPCKFCPTILRWIETPLGGRMPCEAESFVLHPDGDTHHRQLMKDDELHIFPAVGPLPPGRYFTIAGISYQEFEAPRGVELFIAHWARCPGAAFARRKNKKKGQET